jgi:hypothetical protein
MEKFTSLAECLATTHKKLPSAAACKHCGSTLSERDAPCFSCGCEPNRIELVHERKQQTPVEPSTAYLHKLSSFEKNEAKRRKKLERLLVATEAGSEVRHMCEAFMLACKQRLNF